jgi:hypothetical protein
MWVITLIRGAAEWGRLWIGSVLFIWLAVFLCWLSFSAGGRRDNTKAADPGCRVPRPGETWS